MRSVSTWREKKFVASVAVGFVLHQIQIAGPFELCQFSAAADQFVCPCRSAFRRQASLSYSQGWPSRGQECATTFSSTSASASRVCSFSFAFASASVSTSAFAFTFTFCSSCSSTFFRRCCAPWGTRKKTRAFFQNQQGQPRD